MRYDKCAYDLIALLGFISWDRRMHCVAIYIYRYSIHREIFSCGWNMGEMDLRDI